VREQTIGADGQGGDGKDVKRIKKGRGLGREGEKTEGKERGRGRGRRGRATRISVS